MVRYLRVKKFRKKKNAQPEVEQPKLMMDIIEEEYPEKYDTLKEKISQLGRMFTQEEWLTILMRSRAEHERFLPKKTNRESKD
ncbi:MULTISPECIES: hypothetical protein [Desulfitobacterium]|uniref:Uncharacterized protein n=2 Tax=Desulfitobacterium dehalogenans TaxID=36854 RepID=I4A912_DESDJ|nr:MULTISPECIES: hypothetical protein [Desulfitobacterium]AFM00447.1 hypothetical protein Desde_2063 [Desulfitobacterium dehalogenans ATCC 51507]HHY26598.1 hypothetical protein [Desulfitobacterium dehalogenans]